MSEEKSRSKEEIQKIILELKPGDIFWDDDGYKCHVLVNLYEEGRIVFKYFGKHKQYWHYNIESYFWFELRLRTYDGWKALKFKKSRKQIKARK